MNCPCGFPPAAEFGARPRKLFVVVNPVSGRGYGLHTWLEVQKLFELAEVEVEAVGELRAVALTGVARHGV